MSPLPLDLLDEILCRLPVKPLLQFRCVSKEWCALIDSTAFIKNQLKKTLEGNIGGGLFIHSSDDNFYVIDFDSLDDPLASVLQINDPVKTILVDSKFVGASNGLICVHKNGMKDVFLFNPTTRQCRKIAHAPPDFPTSFTAIESSLCGFGYDHANDDYKVVKIAECYSKFIGTIAVMYSLKTNSWTQIQNVPDAMFNSKRGVFASGSLHWMAMAVRTDHIEHFIVGFDLELQQFKEVPFPPTNLSPGHVKTNVKRLVDVGGSLCVTDNYPSHMDVWVMKIYGANNTWYKALSVKQGNALGSFITFRPVAFSKGCNDLLLEVDREKLVWYDLKRKNVKNVRIRGIPINFQSYLYTESLLQLTEDKKDKPLQKPSHDKQGKKQQKERDDFLSRGFSLKL